MVDGRWLMFCAALRLACRQARSHLHLPAAAWQNVTYLLLPAGAKETLIKVLILMLPGQQGRPVIC